MFQGMRVLVAGKHYIGILEQLHTDHVTKCVVLLVDSIDGSIGHLGTQAQSPSG